MSERGHLEGCKSSVPIEVASCCRPRPEVVLTRERLIEAVDKAFWAAYGGRISADVVDAVLVMLIDDIAAMPEYAATKGRDFGRGYAYAIGNVTDRLRGLTQAGGETP